LVKSGHSIDSVILDSKIESKKDLEIFFERTQNSFPKILFYDLEEMGIPFFFVNNHSSLKNVNLIKSRKIDLIINAGTPRIVKSNLIEAANIGVVSVHPGLLPEFRGCTCVEWAIYLDQPIGNTVFFINTKIDEGPIIIKEKVMFKKSDNYSDIRTKVYIKGFDLLSKGISKIINKNLNPQKLPNQKKGSYFKPIDKEKMLKVLNIIEQGNYKYQCL